MLFWALADSPELLLTLQASWLAAIWVCMAQGFDSASQCSPVAASAQERMHSAGTQMLNKYQEAHRAS